MCAYCNFDANEYVAEKDLEIKKVVDGTKQDIECWLEEDCEYDHFICVNGTYMELHISIEYCPKCGRKLWWKKEDKLMKKLKYIFYLLKWEINHSGKLFKGMSPVCFNEWLDIECAGER